ncbi:EthD domain-containing protein [Zoogloea sp.]|uniref:EthD domain-containing protein n=1 Tax=Zoogloea sp. TaxID=49181 RepID=UPI00262AAF41|nr:EthD domain-containing protein [Zoogloea sp.]
MSWKMIYLARRNPALAPVNFPRAWREHSALGAGCTNVRDKVKSVRQCSRDLDNTARLAGASADYDGVNLLVLRDRQAADDIWNDEETLRVMRPDEPRVFSTWVRDFTLIAEEAVLRDGEPTDCVVTAFLGLGPGHDHADLDRALAAVDPGLWLADPAFGASRRLVVNRVDGTPPPGYDYALILEAWFPDPASAVRAFGAIGLPERLPRAVAACIDPARSVTLLARVTHRRP